jgi:hypothetical protein
MCATHPSTTTPQRLRLVNKIEQDLLPDGRTAIKAARPVGSISGFVGLLAGKTQKVAPIEEINEAAAQGLAGVLAASSGR